MFNDAYLAIIRFMEMGGDVLWFIAAITFLMWSLIFERIWFFRTEHKTMVLEASSKWEGRSERKSWSAHQVREGIISDGATRIAGSLPIIETCVALCPLFGLLGTVTGMIRTFQSITLFGAGDPRMMAGGISEALVTTMLGLVTAIPLVLLHAALANNTKKIVDTLDEQSAGLIAQQE